MQSGCSGARLEIGEGGLLHADGVLLPTTRWPTRVDGWRSLISEKAHKYQIPQALVASIMAAESAGRPEAVSYAGALGLMQVMPGTANYLAGRRMTREEVLDPSTNVDLGAKYLAELMERYSGNLVKVPAGYNAGSARCTRNPSDRWGLVQNRGYVEKVLRLYNQAILNGYATTPTRANNTTGWLLLLTGAGVLSWAVLRRL